MEIQHRQNETGGSFYLPEAGEQATELVYKMGGPHKMIIEHTGVSEKNEGKGIGRKLVLAAVEFARLHNMKVLPRCTFAKAILEKSDEYRDVLASYV